MIKTSLACKTKYVKGVAKGCVGGRWTIVSLEEDPVRCQSLEIRVPKRRVIVLFEKSVTDTVSLRRGDFYSVLQPNNDIPIEDMARDRGGWGHGIDGDTTPLAKHVLREEQRKGQEQACAPRHGGCGCVGPHTFSRHRKREKPSFYPLSFWPLLFVRFKGCAACPTRNWKRGGFNLPAPSHWIERPRTYATKINFRPAVETPP